MLTPIAWLPSPQCCCSPAARPRHGARAQERAPGAGPARRLRERKRRARIRRRGAGALRDRSRLPRRRQDRHARRQCRRPRARRRRGGAARSAGPAAAGRERRGRACRRDLESRPGRRRSRALHHAEGHAASPSVADFDRKKAANDEAEGRLERAKRALDLARNQLAYAELKADADGVITATLAEPGQVVAIGQAVARLAHRGEKEAVVALPETWLGEARKSKATVRLWSDRDRSFAAQLRELSPQADPATRTYAARFTIADADDTVAFGMTATVTLSHARPTRRSRGCRSSADPQPRHRPVGLRGRRRPARWCCGR